MLRAGSDFWSLRRPCRFALRFMGTSQPAYACLIVSPGVYGPGTWVTHVSGHG